MDNAVNMKSKSVSLLELAKMKSFGPIQIGKRLSEFAIEVGPPAKWADFSNPKRLTCIMVFGDVEVGFEARKNDLVVTWAKFWMHGFDKRKMNFTVDIEGHKTSVFNPFKSKFPTFAEVETELVKRKLKFTKNFREPVGSDTTAVMNFGPHLKFYYTQEKKPRLTLVTLS